MATTKNQTLTKANSKLLVKNDSSYIALREQFLDQPETTDLSSLRPVIERSWRRSVACKVGLEASTLGQSVEVNFDELLLRCAEPVLTELESLCIDTGSSVVLTDADATLAIFRGDKTATRQAEKMFPIIGGSMREDVVGTNSDGTALEEGVAVQVWGSEHFNEALYGSFCTSVPIRDPLRKTIRGILGLMIPASYAEEVDPRSILMLVQGASAEVTRLLSERMAVKEQTLMTEYLKEVRKRGSEAVIVMDDRTTIASRSALSMLEQNDYGVIGAYAKEACETDELFSRNIKVGPGQDAQIKIRPVDLGEVFTSGAVIRLKTVEAKKLEASPMLANVDVDTIFNGLAGQSIVFKRALEAAATAISRQAPAYIIGEPGTGKKTLALRVASSFAKETELYDFRNFAINQPPIIGQIENDLISGRAVVLHRVDTAQPHIKVQLSEFFSRFPNPKIIATAEIVSSDLLPIFSELRGIEINLPALRGRREDIVPLAEYFLAELTNSEKYLSKDLKEAISRADWFGNLRQLREVIANAADRSITSEVRMSHLTEAHRRGLVTSKISRLEEAELGQIQAALIEAAGNRLKAATILGIGRSTLYRKMDMYISRGFNLFES